MTTYDGECFCGAVKVEVSGEPEAMGYCHCRSCRSWSGGPVNAFTLWKPDAVRITAGAEHVGMYKKTPASERQYCKKCGGHLMTNHPPFGSVDVFAATLPTLKFSPGVHVNYAETVLPIWDGLPKFKDFPAEFGGSGEQIAGIIHSPATSSANGCRPRRGFWRDDDAHHTVLPVRVGPGHPRRFGNLTCRPAVDQQNMMADNRPALHDCRTFEVH